MVPDQRAALLALYDTALPPVYGYLLPWCGGAVAEDLATFLADAVQRRTVHTITIARLVGIARHKLVDHWRRVGREDVPRRRCGLSWLRPTIRGTVLDAARARSARLLGPHHRTVLSSDGSTDPASRAADAGCTVHATEALSSTRAFRRAYDAGGDDAD